MSDKLSGTKVKEFWEYMSQHYDTTVLQKNSDLSKILKLKDFSLDALKELGTEIYAVALFLDKLKVMDVGKFMNNYATTLGDRIYIPFEPGKKNKNYSLKKQMVICVHEHQHVLQFRKEPFAFAIRYLADRAQRAMFEAECYRCNMEIEYALTGTMPKAEGYAKSLKNYACTDEDIAVVEKALKLSAQTIKAGGVTTKASGVALKWMTKNL